MNKHADKKKLLEATIEEDDLDCVSWEAKENDAKVSCTLPVVLLEIGGVIPKTKDVEESTLKNSIYMLRAMQGEWVKKHIKFITNTLKNGNQILTPTSTQRYNIEFHKYVPTKMLLTEDDYVGKFIGKKQSFRHH